jgi:phenylpropionate dioxygenase-like ring-hydroxylating dioxygenase large terminal subunit
MATQILDVRGARQSTELRAQTQTFPRNQWYVAAGRPEIGRALLGRKILGENVAMYRTEAGQAVALSDWCPHRGFSLSHSTLVGDTIQCGYHGMRFGASGACTHIPSQGTIPNQMRVRTFPLVEQSCYAWIWMGDPDKADPALIPDVSPWENGLTGDYVGYATFDCNAQLLIENVADVSHSSFLHPGLLDNAAGTEFMEVPLKVEVKGNVVEAVQDFGDFTISEGLAPKVGIAANTTVHRLRLAREIMPSLHMSVDIYSDREDRSKMLFQRLILGGITPADDRSCHHFSGLYSTSPEANASFVEAGRSAIDQDRVAVDFSQRSFEEAGDNFKELILRVDQAAILTRRIVADMARAEQG